MAWINMVENIVGVIVNLKKLDSIRILNLLAIKNQKDIILNVADREGRMVRGGSRGWRRARRVRVAGFRITVVGHGARSTWCGSCGGRRRVPTAGKDRKRKKF